LTIARIAALLALALLTIGCSMDGAVVPAHQAAVDAARSDGFSDGAEAVAPEDEGLDSNALIALTEWIRDHRAPIFSLLVSRNGRLVYELYTSSLTREHAHYQMSVTKSVLSALVGVAIDRGLLTGPDASVTETLPRALFASDADFARFRPVTIHHVLGMSALDAPDPPRVTTPEAIERHRRFRTAPNRLRVALAQPLLESPGRAYQYNDVTPTLAVGVVQYATRTTALEFAEQSIFQPMEFRNYEWMHQDPAGLDLGGFGLRLRPIDMQKFGVLYLNGGRWRGRSLISRDWIQRSFSPWNRSRPQAPDPDYGWFWWRSARRFGGAAHIANGWKGQRIAVLPRLGLVVTMTACIEDGSENVFNELLDRFVVPSVRGDRPLRRDPAAEARLARLREVVRTGPSRIGAQTETRMIPSIQTKDRRVPFRPSEDVKLKAN